jgi:hypothetical protein
MDKFLDSHNQLKLNQQDIKHLNRLITNNEIETVVKSFPTKKSPIPDKFIVEIYQTCKEKRIPIPSNFSRKKKGKKHYQTHSMKPLLHKLHKTQ